MITSCTTTFAQRRKTRRLIGQALAGAALGVGLLTIPALAANHIVNTTNDIVDPDDGLISLREAITAANADPSAGLILFDEEALGQDPIFTLNSPLPSITNWSYPEGVNITTFDVGTIQIPRPLAVSGGTLSIYGGDSTPDANSTVIGDVNLAAPSSYLYVVGGNSFDAGELNVGGSASLNGDVIFSSAYGSAFVTGGIGNTSGMGGNANLNGNVIMNGNLNTFYLTGGQGEDSYANGTGGDANLTGNVTINDSENQFYLSGGQGFTSGATGGNAKLTGNVTVNNDGWFVLSGGEANSNSVGGDVNLTGNITVNDTGQFSANGATFSGSDATLGNVTLQGDITLNNNSRFSIAGVYLNDDSSGGDIAVSGSNLRLNDDSRFIIYGSTDDGSNNSDGNIALDYGDIVLNGNSSFEVTGSTWRSESDGGKIDINAHATLNDDSLFYLIGGKNIEDSVGAANFTGGVKLNDTSGYYLVGGDGDSDNFGANASITGNIDLYNRSDFTLNGGDGSFSGSKRGGNAFITGDVTLYNDSGFYLTAAEGTGTSTGGDAFITGDVVLNDFSYFGLTSSFSYSGISGNGYIDGKITLNDNSYLYVSSYGNGNSYATGDVTLNDSSTLSSSGTGELNTDGGETLTSFSRNAAFAPLLSFTDPSANHLTVNNLLLSDSLLQPSWNTDESTFTLGQTFNILHYNGAKTGEFSSGIVSPLTFDIDYGSGSDDDIKLTLTGLDYTNMGGNENQRSLENYLNLFQDTSQGQITLNQADLPFDLSILTAQLNNLGVRRLNEFIPDNIAAHNAQAYWNQKSFVDSILANLQNTDNQTRGISGFAMNKSLSAGQVGMQLASLRNAMNAPMHRLGLNENNAVSSSGVWAAYNGAHSHIDADGGIGSNAWSASSNGYTVGYTGAGNGFRWGVAAGHQESDLSFNDIDASGEIAGYNAGLYAAWTGKSTYLNAILGYGDYDNDAYGTGGDTHFTTKALSGAVELGRHIGNRKSGLTPYASLLWTRVKNEDVIDGDSGLSLHSGSNNVFTTALGMRYTHRMYDKSDSLKGGWEAGLAWLHQFGDTGFDVNAAYSAEVPGSFRAQTTPLDGNSLQVRLGAYGRIHGNLIGFAGYQGTFGSSQKINAVNAGVGYQF